MFALYTLLAVCVLIAAPPISCLQILIQPSKRRSDNGVSICCSFALVCIFLLLLCYKGQFLLEQQWLIDAMSPQLRQEYLLDSTALTVGLMTCFVIVAILIALILAAVALADLRQRRLEA